MVMKIVLLVAAVSAAVAVPQKHSKAILDRPDEKTAVFGRPNDDFVDYYDCKGQANGDYVHPFDCTRFITCSNGNAADMACPDCDQNNVVQCAGSKYLMFDGTKTYCDWPSESVCHAVTTVAPTQTEEPATEPIQTVPTTPEEPITSEPTRTPAPTTPEQPETEATEDPTTEDQTTEDPTTEDPTTEDPTTEDPTTEDTTTEDPTTPEEPITEPEVDPTTDPTTSPEEPITEPTGPPNHQTCGGKKAGDACPKDDCEKCGYCWEERSFFLSCQRTFPSDPKHEVTGVIVHRSCDDDLWWNPDAKPASIAEGGACDRWENLSVQVQNKYKTDSNCVKAEELCEYGQDVEAKCSDAYWFFDPVKMTDRQLLNCAAGLLWDPTTETCRACEHVLNHDNSTCSC